MKKLGRVLSISNDNKLIVKTEQVVKLGMEVYDEKRRHVGTIIDFFGPAYGPYVVVSAEKESNFLLGKDLFVKGKKD
ncbi:MAG: Gar1/Naf1 family protein [archaeon]